METRGRALYNSILLNWQEDPTFPVLPWQVEDYHVLSQEELFKRLEGFKISLNKEQFQMYAKHTQSPEELIDMIWVMEDTTRIDEGYLLLFELWRRFLPEKQSLSVFCDELDQLMGEYDGEKLKDEELLQEGLCQLERLLDEHVDQGNDPHAIFQEMALYFAHDLESFIYDFASEKIDQGQFLGASEIVDGFFPYIAEEKWFAFLHLRLLANTEPEEAQLRLAQMLDEQKANPDFEFLLEIARFLVKQGKASYFLEAVSLAKGHIQIEEDFQELLEITCQFYHLLDQKEEKEQMIGLLKGREGKKLEHPIAVEDAGLKQYVTLIKNFDRRKI